MKPKTQHTPGPWFLTNPNPNLDGSDYQQVKSEFNGFAVMGLNHDGSQEAYANARLIAAAPALLESCKWLALFAASHTKSGTNADEKELAQLADRSCRSLERTVREAREAIRQAEGE